MNTRTDTPSKQDSDQLRTLCAQQMAVIRILLPHATIVSTRRIAASAAMRQGEFLITVRVRFSQFAHARATLARTYDPVRPRGWASGRAWFQISASPAAKMVIRLGVAGTST